MPLSTMSCHFYPARCDVLWSFHAVYGHIYELSMGNTHLCNTYLSSCSVSLLGCLPGHVPNHLVRFVPVLANLHKISIKVCLHPLFHEQDNAQDGRRKKLILFWCCPQEYLERVHQIANRILNLCSGVQCN